MALKDFKTLQMLNLASTQIDDAAIPHLKNLTHLHLLILNNTRITPAGFAELEAALPKQTRVMR